MVVETQIKQQVREFYDQIGWQEVSEGVYQNAHYEDLRPVSREYIHRCHMRVMRHLKPNGRFLLDAGSGPIQYPEYLEYSRGYEHRVCLDISAVALAEARKRIQKHGLFVVGDIAHLPFKSDCFDGFVSLHTIHHIPEDEHLPAYQELYRSLAPGCKGVVVNGWPSSRLMRWVNPFIRISHRLQWLFTRRYEKVNLDEVKGDYIKKPKSGDQPKGTFTRKLGVAWMKNTVAAQLPIIVLVWRSVSVRFLRALVHPWLGGILWLRLLYWLEECFPRFFGENGQYPLVVMDKP
ncbi:MAG: class I SAM-dependent methyltransferase [Anaerolineales bacterium]|nr:class I SAM-dependent methyltransferase [Anaerolineales bacterium]